MRLGPVEFRPPLWAVCVVLALLALLLVLGTWQLQRGETKAAIIAERAAAGKMPALALPQAQASKNGARRKVAVTGVYLDDRQLLLDNQVHRGRPGYHVWTPLRRADGKGLVLVDRGWVPLGEDRAAPPDPSAPAGRVQVTGLLRDWPRPGLRLGGEACESGDWPRVVQYPTFDQVACHYAAPVADGLLLLEADAAGGFPRDWEQLGLSPARHYGYALQWYALGLALLVIFVVMNTRKAK